MKHILPKSVERLAEVLSSLPGIGPKTANRLTFYLLTRSEEEIQKFAAAVSGLNEGLVRCANCHLISQADPCPICADTNRSVEILAVVEESLDVVALEKARFNGRYHVLGGQISPLNNVSATDLTIDHLLLRLANEPIGEVILATDPSLEGEATALYIDEQIKNLQAKGEISTVLEISRLARGLPVGGDLEYADELTIMRALEGRKKY